MATVLQQALIDAQRNGQATLSYRLLDISNSGVEWATDCVLEQGMGGETGRPSREHGDVAPQ